MKIKSGALLIFLLLFFDIKSLSQGVTVEDNRFQFGIFYSFRYSNAQYEGFNNYRTPQFKDEYVEGYGFSNFCFTTYYNFEKPVLSLTFGISFLHYGVKESNIILLVPNGNDSAITIIERANVIAIPIGIMKGIKIGKIKLYGEVGLINNMKISTSIIQSEYPYGNPFNSYAIISPKPYFVSTYFGLGIITNFFYPKILIGSILNLTPYNISRFGSPENLKLCQVGFNIGLIFN